MKTNKRVLKTAGLVLAAGLLLFLAIAAASALSGKTAELVYEKADYTAGAAGVEEIRVRVRNMAVQVTPSTGNQITLHYYTCEEDPYEVTLEGGVLQLKYKNDILFNIKSWFSGITAVFGTAEPKVEVMVPAAYAGTLRLDSSNGRVAVSGLSQLGELRINTSNAPIEVSDVSAALVSAQTSNGAVTLDRALVAGAADLRSSNGMLTARQVSAKDSLRMETSNGRIALEEAGSASIELKSSNGSISGSVNGKRSDYTISSDTSNGDDSLGDGGKGPFKLRVSTSNGNIDIRFTQE